MNIPAYDNPAMQHSMDTYVKLTRSAYAVSNRLIERQTLDDLPPSQSDMREALSHLGPLSQTGNGAKLLKSGGNISLIIDNLEKRKLATRQRSNIDRRLVIVSLTQAG